MVTDSQTVNEELLIKPAFGDDIMRDLSTSSVASAWFNGTRLASRQTSGAFLAIICFHISTISIAFIY